jgi:glucose dehydrogenase
LMLNFALLCSCFLFPLALFAMKIWGVYACAVDPMILVPRILLWVFVFCLD